MPKRLRDFANSSFSLRPASESSCRSRRQGSSCPAERSQANSRLLLPDIAPPPLLAIFCGFLPSSGVPGSIQVVRSVVSPLGEPVQFSSGKGVKQRPLLHTSHHSSGALRTRCVGDPRRRSKKQ